MNIKNLRAYMLELEAYYEAENDSKLKAFCGHVIQKIDEPDEPKLSIVES
jgi:hypothetical protein